jgi:hypothetical protein
MSSEASSPGNTPDLNRTDTPRESLWSILRQLKSPTSPGLGMDSFAGFWLRSLSLCLELATDSNVQLISAILPLDLSHSLCPR